MKAVNIDKMLHVVNFAITSALTYILFETLLRFRFNALLCYRTIGFLFCWSSPGIEHVNTCIIFTAVFDLRGVIFLERQFVFDPGSIFITRFRSQSLSDLRGVASQSGSEKPIRNSLLGVG